MERKCHIAHRCYLVADNNLSQARRVIVTLHLLISSEIIRNSVTTKHGDTLYFAVHVKIQRAFKVILELSFELTAFVIVVVKHGLNLFGEDHVLGIIIDKSQVNSIALIHVIIDAGESKLTCLVVCITHNL